MLTQQLAIIYNSPALSIIVNSAGYVQMQYGYGTSSYERLKTDIKTILQLGLNCLELDARKYFQFIFQVLSLLLLAWNSILHPDSPIHQLHQ